MNKKRIATLALAGLMAASSLNVLSSCKKNQEPIKEKRTNVYSGTELSLPEGISYINQLAYANGKAYITYYKEYTITYNEKGEEVEVANHAMMKFSFNCDTVFPAGTVIRKGTLESE